MKKRNISVMALCSLFFSPLASAHVGLHHANHAFYEGVIHPLTGLDHLVMLLAVGVIAFHVQSKAKAALMATSTILLMVSGLLVGAYVAQVSFIEIMVTGSLFVVAIALWNQSKASNSWKKTLLNTASILLVLFHGWAHGSEFSGTSLTQFGLGMATASSLLIITGHYIARFLPAKQVAQLTATCGLLITALV